MHLVISVLLQMISHLDMLRLCFVRRVCNRYRALRLSQNSVGGEERVTPMSFSREDI